MDGEFLSLALSALTVKFSQQKHNMEASMGKLQAEFCQ